MAEALGGFTARQHWDGSPYMIDWYAGPEGTEIGWPEGGTVYYSLINGPEGPDDPLQTAYLMGDSGYVWGFTHVENIQAGRKEKWETFATIGRSGIKSLPDHPAHIHFTASYGQWQQLSPDGPIGNVPAFDVLQRMGFGVEEVARVPGPQDYINGVADAGRFI